MAKTPKFNTSYPGVRYQKHKTRKHGIGPDKYFMIRYQHQGKRKEEGLGWASEGWSAKKAADELARIREAQRTGRGAQSLNEAREIARQEKEADAERLKDEELKAITFSEFWDKEYFPSCQAEKKPLSWQAEESWFKNWIQPGIGNKRLADVSQIDIERIKSTMDKAKLSPRSIQYCLAVIRQVFNEAARRRRFRGENPAKMVKVSLGDNKRVGFLTQEKAAELLAELKNRSLQLHDIALLALHCGLRESEVFSLTWDCVDFEQGSLFIKETKGKKNRHAFMTTDVKKMLMARYQGIDSGFVFLDRNGSRIQRISASFFRAVDALGLNRGVTDRRQKVVFHTLRHTFASWLVQGGEPLYTVSKLLGHSTTAMTERYSHLAPDNMRGAVERMEANLNEVKNGKVLRFHQK